MIEEISYKIGITVGLVIIYVILNFLFKKLLFAHADRNKINKYRARNIHKVVKNLTLCVVLFFVLLAWDVSFEGLVLYFASFFTVLGVGLFANWSILSNVAASFILFFYIPHRIGNKIKIVDGENTIIGVIKDIGLFNIKIKDENGDIVSYPNNLALQKPIIQILSDNYKSSDLVK